MDDRYFLENFNTPLSLKDELNFSEWLADMSKVKGRDMTSDIANYDLRGFYKDTNGEMLSSDQHFTDKYKKPNHPSFSDESMYSGGIFKGGKWRGDDESGWTFVPSAEMLKTTHNPQTMQQYFAQFEPGVGLVMPTQYQ